MKLDNLSSPWGWFMPFRAWLPGVGRNELRADAIAGSTGAIVVLPQGVAFANIAGMPPQYGLYTRMVPAIVAALFGSFRHLVSGPTTAAYVVLFSALSVLAVPGTPAYVTLAPALTFMVGVLELVLGRARMGALVNFFSHSVVVGFTAGAALLIAAKQLTHFFGVETDSGGHPRHLPETGPADKRDMRQAYLSGVPPLRAAPRVHFEIEMGVT